MATTTSPSALEALKGIIPLIGLTGGIGSGKSVVAERLAELGATVIDTDLIAHRVTANKGLAIPAIAMHFGSDFIAADGSLDRAKMRKLVFSNPAARQQLEKITHPIIRAETVRDAMTAFKSGAIYLVFVVPLLLESGGWKSLLDHVVVVDCPPEEQIGRVMRRSKLSRAEVEQIIASQASRAERLNAADTVIENNAGLEELWSKIGVLHQKLLEIKGKSSNSA